MMTALKNKSLPVDVVIIIVNWNRPEETIKAISSISNSPKIKIVVADNGSNDLSTCKLANIKSIDLLCLEKNYGYAVGNNIAVDYAVKKYDPEYILLMNNDALATANALNILYANRGLADIISPKICYPDGKTIWSCGGDIILSRALAKNRGQGETDKGQYDKPCAIDFASGCAMWIRTEVIKSIGLFNPEYQFYYEDADFCYRAKLKGFKIAYLPETIFLHWASTTAGNEYGLFQSKYRWRNRVIFAEKTTGKWHILFFRIVMLPLIVLRDSINYIIWGKMRELANAFKGLLAR